MCAAQGTTVYELLGKLVRAWMESSPAAEARQDGPGAARVP